MNLGTDKFRRLRLVRIKTILLTVSVMKNSSYYTRLTVNLRRVSRPDEIPVCLYGEIGRES